MRAYLILFLLSSTLALSAQKTQLTRFGKFSLNEPSYGYLNEMGDTIIPAGKYNYLPKKIKKNAIVQCSVNPEIWIMLNSAGREIYRIFTIGENPDNFNNGLLRILKEDKIGFINKKGELIIPPLYSEAGPFYKGKSAVNGNGIRVSNSSTDTENPAAWENGKWGIIDKKGQVIKPLEYTRTWNDSLSCYEYRNSKDKFIFTDKGKIITLF